MIAVLTDCSISAVHVRRIRFDPGHQTADIGIPVPSSDTSLREQQAFRSKVGQSKIVAEGSAFYELAKTVARFDATTSEPETFICFYLLNDDQELIIMLESQDLLG
jgi:hypothetical protein